MRTSVLAAEAAMQSFVNCFLRETGKGRWEESEAENGAYTIFLEHQHIELRLPVHYHSLTHRHLFSFPLYYKPAGDGKWVELDLTLTASLLLKELALENDHHEDMEEMMYRVLQSYELLYFFLEERKDDASLYPGSPDFIQSEQSLVLGHLLHPAPKSRQGMDREADRLHYSPETKGALQLHYFRAPRALIEENSSDGKTAVRMVKDELQKDPEAEAAFKQSYCGEDDSALIPVHPLQAEHLLTEPAVRQMVEEGKLQYLGPHGKKFKPTSSIRTLFHEQSPYMYKCSIPVKVTNSLRVNQKKELERGIEVNCLLQGPIGEELAQYFSSFHVIRDPAYITLKGGGETGFETIIRENPFQEEHGENVVLAAGLFHDPFQTNRSPLAGIIRGLAEKEDRSTAAVSIDWFQQYLTVSLYPLMWLYATHGIALEAHQQNSIVKMKEGYPAKFYYRDNQGYYFCESKAAHLRSFVPELNHKSDTVCADAIAEERFRYYFFINHLFGLINGFGTSGLAKEQSLLDVLRKELKDIQWLQLDSPLLESLLWDETIPSKANLLTRFYDMDELTGELATQSVYVQIPNPLKEKERVVHDS
ncbi:IucA/IucC family protein [Salibacterium aidingense]|uniref:IucA/IucC family protein n=1 Tax=Salibacterium aidingense TaxID=384933 RepID=UPI003BBFF7AD